MYILPPFVPTKRQRDWVENERRTAQVISLLWRSSSQFVRADEAFLRILIQSSWVNGEDGPNEACRQWRNKHYAEWLELPPQSDDKTLAMALRQKLSLTLHEAQWLVTTPSGITAYYRPFRPAFLKNLHARPSAVRRVFAEIARHAPDPDEKIRRVAKLALSLPSFRIPNGGSSAMMNGLSATIACLDPQRRFPIVNARTQPLLSALRCNADEKGVVALGRLIGNIGIEDAFDLDVYAASSRAFTAEHPRPEVGPRTIGLKAEEDTYAHYGIHKVRIRRIHNALINRFCRTLKGKRVPFESEYDALIPDWKPGRWLLVEAKTETSGVHGRTQLRQAIGQLFDYRMRSFPDQIQSVDLALLTPTRPADDVLALLAELRIEALWFTRRGLSGTVSLTSR